MVTYFYSIRAVPSLWPPAGEWQTALGMLRQGRSVWYLYALPPWDGRTFLSFA